MAGESAFAAQFNEPAFRDAIRQTMLMGMPEDPAERLTWWWKRNKTFTPQDRIRKPYDWTQTPTTNVPDQTDLPDPGPTADQSLQVPYALEFQARAGSTAEGTSIGVFNTSRAVVTLMDEDYEQIRDADYCTIGNATYEVDFAGPPMGLFAVTVHQVYLRTRDES